MFVLVEQHAARQAVRHALQGGFICFRREVFDEGLRGLAVRAREEDAGPERAAVRTKRVTADADCSTWVGVRFVPSRCFASAYPSRNATITSEREMGSDFDSSLPACTTMFRCVTCGANPIAFAICGNVSP